LPLGWRWCQ